MKEEINKWIRQASEDLTTAKIIFKNKRYYAAILFCQQTVEKDLKALWLKEKGENIPLIHDLALLGKKLNLPNKFFMTFKELTSSYTETRYPDSSNIIPSKKFTKSDAEKYVKSSKEILKWVKDKI